MKSRLLVFLILLLVFISCKSSINRNSKAERFVTFIKNLKINNYEIEFSEFDDPSAFHLLISISSVNGGKSQRKVRINDNEPHARRLFNDEYMYLRYMGSSLPYLELKTDDNGELDIYFLSEDEFEIYVDYFHDLKITPQFGKTMNLTIYMN